MNKEQSLLYALKQIQKIINMVLDKDTSYDALEPNYGRKYNGRTKQGSDPGQAPEYQSNNCEVCDWWRF